MLRPLTILFLCSGLIAGCAPNVRQPPKTVSANTVAANILAPQILREEGLESVIGQMAPSLISRFGQARIDLSEGDARKLQFISQNCVLDIFLYPLDRNSAPIATHIEARQRRGGGAADRLGCIEEVERMATGG